MCTTWYAYVNSVWALSPPGLLVFTMHLLYKNYGGGETLKMLHLMFKIKVLLIPNELLPTTHTSSGSIDSLSWIRCRPSSQSYIYILQSKWLSRTSGVCTWMPRWTTRVARSAVNTFHIFTQFATMVMQQRFCNPDNGRPATTLGIACVQRSTQASSISLSNHKFANMKF